MQRVGKELARKQALTKPERPLRATDELHIEVP